MGNVLRNFNIRKLSFLALLCGLSFVDLSAQNSLVWHFGQKGMLDFRDGSGGVTEFPDGTCGPTMSTSEGSSGYTHSGGEEVFYTDGRTVYYPNGDVMATNFKGDPSSSSSAIIVKSVNPLTPDYYYMFNVSGTSGGSLSQKVHYSIFDFSDPLNATVVLKDKALSDGVLTEKITVIPKTGAVGYWVLIPGAGVNGNSVILTYDLSTAFNETPVQINEIGINTSTTAGWMQANPQGTQITVIAAGHVHLLDFDAADGKVLYNRQLSSSAGLFYGAVFSPSGEVVYATEATTIHSYDLASNSHNTFAPTGPYFSGAIQAGPNGKLYVATNGGSSLHVFNTPDEFNAAGFLSQGQTLSCAGSSLGLPTFVPGLIITSGCTPPALAEITPSTISICDGNSITLQATVDAGKYYTWYDEDDVEVGTSGIDENTLTISSVGTKSYYVVIADPADLTCKATSVEVEITIYSNPSLGTGATIIGDGEVCPDESNIVYDIQDTDNDANGDISYVWTFNPNNTNFIANAPDGVKVSFASADVTMTVEIEETHGSLVCTGGTVQKTVTVDALPTVTFAQDPVTVGCNSTKNKLLISNFDAINNDYSIGAVLNATNVAIEGQFVSFDVTNTDGTIEIIATSKNGALCTGTGIINFSKAGCNSSVTVDKERVCPNDLLVFTSEAVAGTNETIVGYSWSVNGNGVIQGASDQSTVSVKGINTSTIGVTVIATVEVTFEKNGQQVVVSDLISSIVNPLPDLSVNSITGMNPVCEGTKELYTYSDATYSTYNWLVVNGDKTSGGNNKEIQEVNFANSVITNQVELSVEIGETIGGVECFATDQIMLVDIDALPIVIFANDPVTVACNSTGNTVSIGNYDATNYTYSVGTETNVANVSLSAGEITFDVTSTTGSIEIIAVSKTGATCQGNGVMNYSTAGCNSDVSVNKARVCPEEIVVFTSDAVATGGESIVSYNWVITGDGAIQGASNQSTLSVKVDNTANSEVILKATVDVVYEKNGQQIIISTDGTVTVNPLPDLSSSAITGKNPVCEGSTEIYTYSDVTYASYAWSVTNGELASGGNGNEKQGVSFENSNLSNQVEISVEIGETIGGVTCLATDNNLLVDIEETPVVNVDNATPTLQCNSSINTVQITNYDQNSTYDPIIVPSGMTVTIDNTGKININAGTATVGGTVVIKQTSATACESEAAATMVVSLTGCGRTVNFTIDAIAVCHGDTVTFTQDVDLGSGGAITNYVWSFGNGTAIDPVSGINAKEVRVIVQNLTTAPLTLSGTLMVDFTDDPKQLSANKSVVVINQLPLLSVLGSLTGASDVCVGSQEAYSLTHPDSNDFDYAWSNSDGTGQAGAALNEYDITFDNITDFTTPVEVKVSVKDKVTGCFSSDTLTKLVNVDAIPEVTFPEDPLTVPCESLSNKVSIANYDATNFTYSLGASTNATNVTLVNDEITFDVVDLGGTIEINVVSKTGGLCAGNGVLNFVTSGCNSDVTVTADRVCPGETVTFTSNAVAGQGETIESYSWSFVGEGTVVGPTNQSTLTLEVGNSTTTEVTLNATVNVVFEKSNQQVTISTDGVVTVNPLPELTTAQINGKNPVCENAKELYTYSDATFSSYEWSVFNADLETGGNDAEIQDIDFVNSIISDQVKISVIVGETIGGVICKATDDTLFVNIEALPTVDIDPAIGIQCSSSDNTIQINNYDATADYSIITYTGGLTGVTEPDASGLIIFDAGTAESTGQISIPITNTTGAQCASADDTEVTVSILGCEIGIEPIKDTCTTVDGVEVTFTSVLDNTADVVGYRWEIVGNGATYTGPTTGESVTGLMFNNTTSIGYFDVTLYVDYGGTTGEIASQLFTDFVKVHVRPDINEALSIVDGLNASSCSGDLHDFVIPDIDPTRDYAIWFFSSTVADEVLVSSNLVDTISIRNGTDTYWVHGSVTDPATGCVVTDSVEVIVAIVPEFEGIFGDTLFCEYSSTQRDTSVYKVIDNDQFDVTWTVESIGGSDVSGVSIQDNYRDEDNNVYDTIVDVFVNGKSYMGSKYLLKAKGLYTGACIAEDSATIEFTIDETFKVDFTIVPEKDFCESDLGYFHADLSQAIDDVNGTFGSADHHYSITTWSYNDEDFKSDNLWDTSADTYYSEYTANDDVNDIITEGEYVLPLDTTWSTIRGPFQLEDEISLSIEPQFCWHRDSDLVDTLEVKPQQKPIVDLLINGDKVHVLTDIVNVQEVDVYDGNNIGGVVGRLTIYGYFNTDSSKYVYVDNKLRFANFQHTPPLGYDTVKYIMVIEEGVCEVLDSAILIMDYALFPPTVFTPNGDGIYDTWQIENIEKYPTAKVQVFNRWGSLLFETNNYINNEWDGSYNGNVLPRASYYYVIDLGDGGEPLSGAVSIIK